VECHNSSGAKHRSFSGTKLNAGHAFTARTEAVDSTPATSFLAGFLAAPLAGPFTDTQHRGNLLSLWRLQEVLEVTVFREDIIERLIQNIVGGCVDEGGVLIDLRGGRLIQPNGSTDVTALVDLE
jgi:hypothetical protein